MTTNFEQRVLENNFISRLRNLEKAVEILKFRQKSTATTESSGGDAADITYTPADTADWDTAADPGNADEAFDQLAARTKDLEGFTGLSSPVAYGFEVGMIIQWSGAIVDIPTGWQLCDGTNGTPDLRDKFIVGAGSTYNPGNTGGAANHDHDYSDVLQHTHPVSITDLGHNHTQNPHTHVQDPHQHGMAEGTTDGSGTFMDRSNAAAATTAVTDNATATNQTSTAINNSATTGITASTSNPSGSVAAGTTDTASSLPPYYALAFIMCMELGAGVANHAHDPADISDYTPTYTPTLTNVLNVSASVLNQDFIYTRVGSVVMVSGSIQIDPTAAGQAQVRISLPVASNLGTSYDLNGTATMVHSGGEAAGSVIGDDTNNAALITIYSSDGANRFWRIMFMYRVL